MLERVLTADLVDFAGLVFEKRQKSLNSFEIIVDTTMVEAGLLPKYVDLIDAMRPASVTDYFGGFPLLSLFLLYQKRISKLNVVVDDVQVAREVHSVVQSMGLNCQLSSRPLRADLGFSLNGLFVRSNHPVEEHGGLGVFAYFPAERSWGLRCKWKDFENVKTYLDRFDRLAHDCFTHDATVAGFSKFDQFPVFAEEFKLDMYYAFGYNV